MENTATPAPNLKRVVLASSVGTLIEYYDFLLYGSLAAIFADLFFPNGDPLDLAAGQHRDLRRRLRRAGRSAASCSGAWATSSAASAP
ncbi:MAG: hypothetical protein WDO24_12400 [Pseudomonadota bacterium]